MVCDFFGYMANFSRGRTNTMRHYGIRFRIPENNNREAPCSVTLLSWASLVWLAFAHGSWLLVAGFVLLSFSVPQWITDIYALGVCLVNNYGCFERSDFNKIYRVVTLETASPKNIEVKEHKWIHRTESLRPLGINIASPFSLPLQVFRNPTST